MDLAARVQILNEAVSILYIANAVGNYMNPIILRLDMKT